jgi:hypothetical protein
LPVFTYPAPRAVESAFGQPAENIAVHPFKEVRGAAAGEPSEALKDPA